MKFRYEYLSITDLGALFGLGRRDTGKMMKEIGLRDKYGNPTSKAITENYLDPRSVESRTFKNNCWHTKKTVQLLQKNGLQILKRPPSSLVEPPSISTPLSYLQIDDVYSIYNSCGEELMLVYNKKIAEGIVSLINRIAQLPLFKNFFP